MPQDWVFIESADRVNLITDMCSPAGHFFMGTMPDTPFSVVPVEGKGLAMIALGRCRPGQHILEERPILVGPNLHRLNPWIFPPGSGAFESAAVAGLRSDLRKAFWTLHNAFPEKGAHGIVETNSVTVEIPGAPGVAYGAVYPTFSRINHSCTPNANIFFDTDTFEGKLHAMRPIEEGEEITISYVFVEASRAERQARLARYGFVCSCEACSLTGRALEASEARRKGLADFFSEMRVNGSGRMPPLDWFGLMDQAKDEGLVEAEAFVSLEAGKECLEYAGDHFDEKMRKVAEKAAASAAGLFRRMEGWNSPWGRKADAVVRAAREADVTLPELPAEVGPSRKRRRR